MKVEDLRNIAIVAHVDHGKTTLVSELLWQSGFQSDEKSTHLLDSNALEKERGITILAKNTALAWKGVKINMVDTPGHADFSGEIERILSMVDSVLVLVDAVEGPMPQTRFVTEMALSNGLSPIVVINKCDRPAARPSWVLDKTFDLFEQLGATDSQLDFPTVYCSATEGYARLDPLHKNEDMTCLLDGILENVSPPHVEEGPFQMQISALDHSDYVGTIGIGKVVRGELEKGTRVEVLSFDGKSRSSKVNEIFGYEGLNRVPIDKALTGDIVAITGLTQLKISDTVCDMNFPERLPGLKVEEPTITVSMDVSDSPFASVEGDFVTSRQILERLQREVVHNVALRMTTVSDSSAILVSGRGELHLSVLFETMRREGYSFCVGRPQAIVRTIDGEASEPYEVLVADVPQEFQGRVMEQLGNRGGRVQDIGTSGSGDCRLEYLIPSRGLIGYRTEFMTSTSGQGRLNARFEKYGPIEKLRRKNRNNGVLVSKENGKCSAFALFNLQERGKIIVMPGAEIFEGMIVGIHSRDNDLVVNPIKGKQLTNIRAASSDENIVLTPPIEFTLEQALEFIEDDELVDVTPKAIRLRKKILRESDRKRLERKRETL